jgi:uncharacterized protein YqeY
MLKDKINQDYMEAFRAKDTLKKNLLSVVKGEIQTIEKNQGITNLPDEEVVKILNKTAKSLREIFVTDNSEVLTDVRLELDIIESYLPKQMTQEEITEKIQSLIAEGASNMGEIMKAFANLPADRKLVSQIYTQVK